MTTEWQDFRWKQQQAFEEQQRLRAIQQRDHDNLMKSAQQRDALSTRMSQSRSYSKKRNESTVFSKKKSEETGPIVLFIFGCLIVFGFFYGIYLGILYLIEKTGIGYETASPTAAILEILLTTGIIAFFYRKQQVIIWIVGLFAIVCYFYLRWSVIHAT